MDFTHSTESVGEKEGLYSPATSLPRRTCGVWQCKQNHRLRSFRTAAQLPAAHTILISDASRWTRSQPQTIRLTRPDSLPSHHEKNKWWRTEKTKDERKQEDTPLFFFLRFATCIHTNGFYTLTAGLCYMPLSCDHDPNICGQYSRQHPFPNGGTFLPHRWLAFSSMVR